MQKDLSEGLETAEKREWETPTLVVLGFIDEIEAISGVGGDSVGRNDPS